MPFQIRFVTAVGESDDDHTRLDLTPMSPAPDWRRVQLGDGADFGWPQLATTWAAGVGGHGDQPVASRYVNRRITLPIAYTHLSTTNQRRAALAALARELDRDRNVLYLRPEGTSEGRWLITYRAAETAAKLLTWGPASASLDVQLDAEPFAYGPLETITDWVPGGPTDGDPVDGTLFSADQPASEGTGGQWYRQTTSIRGDVDAPMSLRITPADGGQIDRSVIVASRPVGHDDTDLIRYHATSADAAAGDAVNTASAGSSGGDEARLSTSSVVTGTAELVMSAPLPSMTDPQPGYTVKMCNELAGRWRVMAKVRQVGSGNRWEVYATAGAGRRLKQTAETVTSSAYTWVDLGVMQLGEVERPHRERQPVGPATIRLFAAKVAGSSSGYLACDYMIAVPADGRTAVFEPPSGGVLPDGSLLYADGQAGTVSTFALSEASLTYWENPNLPTVGYRGALPQVYPGRTTQLFVVAHAGPTPDTSPLSAVNVEASYYPRYLAAAA